MHEHQMLRQKNLPFFETSAKDGKNITEAFNEITSLALKRRLDQPANAQSVSGSGNVRPGKKGNISTPKNVVQHERKNDRLIYSFFLLDCDLL